MTTIITATLKNIRFQNNSGFLIGMFTSANNKKEFGCLGNMLNPVEGLEYTLSGKWSNHSDFGRQFQFSNYAAIKPIDENGIYKYLVRVAKWIGPTIASRLIDIYGSKTLEALRNDPELIAAEIKGITEKKALEIQEILIEHEEEEAILVELMKILNIPGLRKSLPYELIEKFGSNACEILKKNPYVITQFHGSGFLIADRLAMQSLKIEPNSMFRIKAAIEYAMDQDLHSNGNTWIHQEHLLRAVVELTSIQDLQRVLLGIDELLAREAIVETPAGGWLSLWGVDRDESYVAKILKEMMNHGNE